MMISSNQTLVQYLQDHYQPFVLVDYANLTNSVYIAIIMTLGIFGLIYMYIKYKLCDELLILGLFGLFGMMLILHAFWIPLNSFCFSFMINMLWIIIMAVIATIVIDVENTQGDDK